LGYAQITGNISTSSSQSAQATGLTLTVTIPAGGRKIKITGFAPYFTDAISGRSVTFEIWDGAVQGGTRLAASTSFNTGTTVPLTAYVCTVITPAAGTKTYNLGYGDYASGTVTMVAGATQPAFILVEAI
jgi:hypothetical protein